MTEQQKVEIKIPDKFDAAERRQIGEAILEFIRLRTQKGLDRTNKPFPGYSKEYTDSVDFKNAGKSANKVDLELSGDMMASLSVLRSDEGSITVGFYKRDKDINGRAEGNIKGTYGQSSAIPGKKRDFLGITAQDKQTIIDRFKSKKERDKRKENFIGLLASYALRKVQPRERK